MPRAWEIKIGHVTVMPRKNFPGDSSLEELINRTKLQLAIDLASQMARKAWLKVAALERGELNGQDKFETQYALAKYFSIHPSDEDYGIYLDGITRVYMKIKDGLAAPYDIVIFDPTDKNAFSKEAVGYTRPTRSIVQQGIQTQAVSPIRQLLRVPVPDEMNHEPWTGYDAVGRIHLSLGVVMDLQPPADHVARTIVHEASHKFARTTDVLYKHASFAKSSQRDADGDPPPAEVTMSIGGKTVTPMAGAKKGERISPHLYLENADSYAWTARRIWKRFKG